MMLILSILLLLLLSTFTSASPSTESISLKSIRRLDNSTADCEIRFFECLDDAFCNSCVNELNNEGLDYFLMPQDMTCDALMETIIGMNLCTSITSSNPGSKNLFCTSFTTCLASSSKPPPAPLAPEETPVCVDDEVLVKINEYDSLSDGWDGAILNITKKSSSSAIYTGTLLQGSHGEIQVCLKPGCYNVDVTSGNWGNECTWDVKPNNGGSVIASGGAPTTCSFPIGGNACANTCFGFEPIIDDEDGNNVDILECLAGSCAIQYADCTKDLFNCAPCLLDDSLSWCSSSTKFNSVVKCASCHCPSHNNPADCQHSGNNQGAQCAASQLGYGTVAVSTWSSCSKINAVNSMLTDWDEDNFGELDDFEKCAHDYQKQDTSANGSGINPEECMQILYNAGTKSKQDIISSIASKLYTNPTDFCECNTMAQSETPDCDTFSRFNTLIRETLDACESLDEIDCPAWQTFSDKCMVSLTAEFGHIDLYKSKQCEYVTSGCGDSGAFPAFRHLDCASEVPDVNWDFWVDYDKACVSKDEPFTPNGGGGGSGDVPYYTPEVDPDPNPYNKGSTDDQGGSALPAVFGTLAIAGVVIGAAYLYKKHRDKTQSDNDSAYRYRPQTDADDDANLDRRGGLSGGLLGGVSGGVSENELFEGLTLGGAGVGNGSGHGGFTPLNMQEI